MSNVTRALLVILSLALLGSVYLFQRMNYLELLTGSGATPALDFIFNKTVRLIINDLGCIILIYALFQERKYLRVAFVLFCIELLILLPAYLTIKLSLEGTSEISSPLLSPIHRLIVNPMLMIMLIVAFYYQRYRERR